MKIILYASKSTADLSTIKSRQHFFLSSISYRSIFSTADPSLIRSDQIKRKFRQHSFLPSAPYRSIFSTADFSLIKWGSPSALLSTIDLIQINISTADFSRSTRTPSALRSIIDSYRPTSDFFSAEIISRKQHHMKIFDDFHIEKYFHRFFLSWDWILNLFHFILFYIQWLVISFWSFSLMKQSYWKKWLLMIELFEKFWKVVVFRRQVCHNQYWLHTDYKPESIKKSRYHIFWEDCISSLTITNFDQSINQSNDRSINQKSDQSIDQSIEITSIKFIYTLKKPTQQNSIKKRKSDDMNEILLFTFNLNRQKISIKLQKIKTTMLKTYVMTENFHMLSIVNQINQLFDENMKIVKIDTNIELLTMQTKLNMIIKN